jgi:hypothetical protein
VYDITVVVGAQSVNMINMCISFNFERVIGEIDLEFTRGRRSLLAVTRLYGVENEKKKNQINATTYDVRVAGKKINRIILVE